MTTVEGVLDRIITNIESDIKLKKEIDPALTDKLEVFLKKIIQLKELKSGPFDIMIDDPSGDSFIENPNAPKKDLSLSQVYYRRNKEQNEMLGIFVSCQLNLSMVVKNNLGF